MMKINHLAKGGAARISLLATIFALILSHAAVAEDFEFIAIDEIPEGPGLVTDDSGEFSIFKWSRDKRAKTAGQAQPSRPAPSQTITSSSGITEAPTPE